MNLLAIPIAAVVTPGGLAVGLLGMVPAVGGFLAGPLAWLLSSLARTLLDASYAGAMWLGCPVVQKPDLVTVGLYMTVLAIFARRCRTTTKCKSIS